MHLIKDVGYVGGFKLLLAFADGSARVVDLENELDGDIFAPLKNVDYFKQVRVNQDLDTIVWDNGADMSPDYLFEIGVPVSATQIAV